MSEQRGPHVFEEISADKKNAAFVDSQPIFGGGRQGLADALMARGPQSKVGFGLGETVSDSLQFLLFEPGEFVSS